MKVILATVFALSLGFAPHLFAQDQAGYQAKLEELQATIKKLEGELDAAKNNRDSLNVELKRSESDIADLLKDIERINSELAAQKKS